jgi:hypothetical protein
MPRVGLPTRSEKFKAARTASQARFRSRPASSPIQMGAVALGAVAFRAVSALVARFAAAVHPHAIGGAETTFGIYPVVVRAVDRSLGQWLPPSMTAAVVVSWIAFAGAMVMLLRVAQLDVDGDRADSAVLLAAVFPFAFVFGGSGPEAMFLMFALGAFYGFRRQMWIVGGLCGACATATIPSGMLIVPALGWIAFRDSAANRFSMLTGLALAIAGVAAYYTYLYYRGGPLGGWAAAMNQWGFRVGGAPWVSLGRLFTSAPAPLDALSGWVTLIALASIPLVGWRLNGGYAIYMIAMLWLPLTSASYDALGRTCALLFPMFVLAAAIRWRVVVVLIAVASAMLYALTV